MVLTLKRSDDEEDERRYGWLWMRRSSRLKGGIPKMKMELLVVEGGWEPLEP
jgi:hypothetical protein